MSGGCGPSHSCHLVSPVPTSLAFRAADTLGELEAISIIQHLEYPQAAEDITRQRPGSFG